MIQENINSIVSSVAQAKLAGELVKARKTEAFDVPTGVYQHDITDDNRVNAEMRNLKGEISPTLTNMTMGEFKTLRDLASRRIAAFEKAESRRLSREAQWADSRLNPINWRKGS